MNKVHFDLDCARVHACQEMLFPIVPREICESLGLNWWAAVKLHADGWLSFNPESLPALDERQEVELRFVGALIAAGCDDAMLHRLLDGLENPFCYRPERVFYNWTSRSWQLLPRPLDTAEEVFSDWIDALEEKEDVSTLEDIHERAASVINRLAKEA
jgi:hypothetical protein